jgi:hypothetical protein
MTIWLGSRALEGSWGLVGTSLPGVGPAPELISVQPAYE